MANLRRSRSFKVGDRVKGGLLGSIGTSTGILGQSNKILTGSPSRRMKDLLMLVAVTGTEKRRSVDHRSFLRFFL